MTSWEVIIAVQTEVTSSNEGGGSASTKEGH